MIIIIIWITMLKTKNIPSNQILLKGISNIGKQNTFLNFAISDKPDQI